MDNIIITKSDFSDRVTESYVFDEEDEKIYKVLLNRDLDRIFANCICETDTVIKKQKTFCCIKICKHIKKSIEVSAKKANCEIEFLKDDMEYKKNKDTYILLNSFSDSLLVRVNKKC